MLVFNSVHDLDLIYVHSKYKIYWKMSLDLSRKRRLLDEHNQKTRYKTSPKTSSWKMALRMLKMQTLVIGSVCAHLMSCKAHYQYHELPEPKMTKVTFPVGVALDVSGSPYRNSMGLPAISRADSTGRSHRMPYGAARTKRVNAHPPWAQLHAIITYHGSISTLHTWEIVCK